MTTEARLSRAALRHIEAELYAYPETKRELEERRRDVIERGMGLSQAAASHRREGSPEWSDPTGVRGAVLADHRQIQHMSRVVDTITAVYDVLPPEKQALVRLWYWERRSVQRVAMALNVSGETAWRWRRGILYAIAERLGWR